ncbi:MAG: DUF47 domain-containing protein [Sphingomonadaceae bacterium]|nr:DUF47 domain-containing protein [Sphingomonadaceae bacterium]
MRWFQALLPKSGGFFELFEAHAATLVAGAEALLHMVDGGSVGEGAKSVQDHEHDADDITRDVLTSVRKTFVTPFDRSAITGLIGSMDDAIDQMNQTAKAIMLFEVTAFEPNMRAMAEMIVEAARTTAQAVPLLRSLGDNANRLVALTASIVAIEGRADEMHEAGLKALFKAHGADRPMAFIIGNEIYSHLERVTDRFEDVANEIQGLVIDHS